ncbi:ABC transporter substrate-binding protein [Aliivibrio fischeri]|uniref:ABC transporter substrate-binding protein n=1 Tax=Aliivibrio fischeri (strain ATCC 700601 / ES114) TaxID=312309 RepID=Q5DYI9_ALIF1|nr:ABC transporter substrate-binding protein [Aliivibrio fischeri]AAW88157.1 ABC transporter substrate-binding protein [Aliivibrio fischeri ES114]KLU80633.1 ABC transporter substrate-binding protein [Aliivibrio fischeri]MBP3139697.1 ABC transporter substrate-binding protein [Aliivibrio fischeri]MBP3154082.1 ABC transporter substrate-binding protein [Aliivibrio fischeri]MCE4936471.1 ABC transporter substrate-binding protein [Aliivibrio fischeri]
MKTLLTSATLLVTTLSTPLMAKEADIQSLVNAAQKEGQVYSVGMPGSWANWKDTWNDLNKLYGLKHQDTDMSSAQEIAKFAAEKNNATADIGDIGFAFARVAVKKGVTQAYKPTTWDSIPDWAKDKDGHWALAYTGTISFISNNKLVKNPPTSWDDLLEGNYKVSVGDVGVAAQANNAVLAAAFAKGGDESNLKPAIKFFAELAKQGRLSYTDPGLANLEKGEVEVALLWDFNALNYRDKLGRDRFSVNIPQDGSVISGYTTIINKFAKNPNSAKLAREYIFSDQGQINLAEGYARPIRSDVVLPQSIQDKLIPNDQYTNVQPVSDFKAWEKSARKLPRQWQENVLINQQ